MTQLKAVLAFFITLTQCLLVQDAAVEAAVGEEAVVAGEAAVAGAVVASSTRAACLAEFVSLLSPCSSMCERTKS